MEEEINQIINTTIEVYKGFKLINGCAYTLRFKPDKESWRSELDANLKLENQKSLTSTKPKNVTFTSYQKIIDSGIINLDDTFFIIDEYESEKIGKGRVIEIVLQVEK